MVSVPDALDAAAPPGPHARSVCRRLEVVERVLAGVIETAVVPSNPLDVVAQQVVAMAALDEWRVEGLAALLRRAHPFRDLGRRSLEAVLDMLSGRYPPDEFGELRSTTAPCMARRRVLWSPSGKGAS